MSLFPPQHARLPGDRFAPVAIPGLVWAYRFREGYAAETLDMAEIPAALAAEDGWLWLHFSLTDKLARTYIAGLTQLPEPARTLLVAGEEQLGLDTAEEAIFGVFADFAHDMDGPTQDVGRLRFALTERLVVSGRRHPLRSVEDIRRAVDKGLAVRDASGLIEAIIDRFCDAVARLAAEMTDELDRIEDHVVADLVASERARLAPVRRTSVRLHRQLASLANVFRDWEEREEQATSALRIDAGRLASRLESLDQDILGVQDRAKLLQDEVAARLADETNRSLRALSVMTALLLPGSLISGIFGMNVHGLPFTESPGGFWIVFAMGGGATALFYWILRRIGAGLRF
ncbi:transporter [Labrys wisconsinensis]|uniref:Zinc transporter n=1 Tax=Labrys wisconsinensis TaxID=425677 RepID=A0ABU0JI99_9HYPH|nr:transporter [Labrys wisconsinensis]MDQ0472979.1 zinc transporter [Labrys wisconsinensis]